MARHDHAPPDWLDGQRSVWPVDGETIIGFAPITDLGTVYGYLIVTPTAIHHFTTHGTLWRTIGLSPTGTDLQPVVYQWSTRHGACHDCGDPAAFHRVSDSADLCAVCAANSATIGENIVRIHEGE